MQFFIVDVFAEHKYQGNQLAVFLLEDHLLSSAEMQQIAKEIRFSETTFILSNKKTNNGYEVRIFTPDIEVPFAGHPSLGTAFIIKQIIEPQAEQVILNLKIGQICVQIDNDEFVLTHKLPEFGPTFQASEIASILSITESDIDLRYPIQWISTGLPSISVPLKSLAAVKQCKINHMCCQALIDRGTKANLLVFTQETEQPDHQLHVRVFMDDNGFLEDAATGSANGNLAAYLLKYHVFKTDVITLSVEQGYEMQRPSLIKIQASKTAEQYRIQVSGKAFLIAQGNWF